MKFKLLNGLHDEKGKVYNVGDIVESEKPLDKMFGDKFARIMEDVKQEVKGQVEPTEEENDVEPPEEGTNPQKRARRARRRK